MDLFRWLKNACSVPRQPIVHIPEDSHAALVRRRFRFSGSVQGVGFRFEAKQIASQLDLVGWVRNQNDGRVIVEIEGKENYIAAFLLAIESVPRFDITEIQTEDLPLSHTETTFRLLYP